MPGTDLMHAADAVVLHRRFSGEACKWCTGITNTGITKPIERNADPTYCRTLEFALPTGREGFEDLLAS